MNTGYKQSILAQRLTRPGGMEVDVDGNLCLESGKRQAIVLLEGQSNADPDRFEVFTYFPPRHMIDGAQSSITDLDACSIPVGYITLSDSEIELTDLTPSRSVTLDCSHAWILTHTPDNLSVSPVSGNKGIHTVTIASKRQGANMTLTFRNTETDDTATLKVTDNAMPEYVKSPVVPLFIETNMAKVQNAEDYAIFTKDWDTPDYALTRGGYNCGTYPTRRIGEYEFTIDNWKMAYQQDRAYGKYIVDQATLDQSHIPLTEMQAAFKCGCYAFAGRATGRYLAGVEVLRQKYFSEGINANLFGENSICHLNVDPSTGRVFDDANAIAFKTQMTSHDTITICREAATSRFAIYQYWTNPENGTSQPVSQKELLSDIREGHASTFNYSFWVLIVVTDRGEAFADLPKIKIEKGSLATPWIAHRDMLVIGGWHVPHRHEWEQLFGMVGYDLSIDNIVRQLFVSPHDTQYPWIEDWILKDRSQDTLGARLLPAGHKLNDDINGSSSGEKGLIYQFGERLALATYDEPSMSENASPTIWIDAASNDKIGNVVYDIMNKTVTEGSIQYWQRNIRFCRPLSDAELGYKLWREDANDRIIVNSLDMPQPANTTELPKGLLRGMAVRGMNTDRNRVLAPLSKLLSEIAKTRNGGEYKWYGWM